MSFLSISPLRKYSIWFWWICFYLFRAAQDRTSMLLFSCSLQGRLEVWSGERSSSPGVGSHGPQRRLKYKCMNIIILSHPFITIVTLFEWILNNLLSEKLKSLICILSKIENRYFLIKKIKNPCNKVNTIVYQIG